MIVPLPQTSPPAPPQAARLHVLNQTLDELTAALVAIGQTKFRARQILEWVYRRGAADFALMTNLSKDFRTWLDQHAVVRTARVSRESVAGDGTRKLLLTLPDGADVETVWIPTDRRHTACISSQVGCPVGCRFCASGLDGVERNLTAGEIVEQAYAIQELINKTAPACEQPAAAADALDTAPGEHRSSTGGRLSNIVLMGMGEPLANYANVIRAIRILNAPWGMGVGARKITLSTVGLPAQIRKLADEDLQLNLALSLHATDDGLRRELIPWGKGVPIAELLDACRHYFDRTGREVTFEYVLLEGVNDRPSHAEQLARYAKRVRANVNLLRYNPVPGLDFRRPSSEAAFEFQRVLRERGVNVHIRTSRGADADAACGQLRRSAKSK
ncbi:MAG: 23S rRNA (adenine(2503)-C(2))-methyltransferase RlmN [Planctomycetes bacterium]|nr:23S rRNA (adenine(2503)-C(2))-methyltransferase RlmN [Planctomycetota bacterium]